MAELVKLKLISNSVITDEDAVTLDQKLVINNLPNYLGNYFLTDANICTIRCFNTTPDLVAIICEYTLDTAIEDVKEVETYLKEIGYTIAKI